MMENIKIACIVVDDEPMALELLKRYVERTPYLLLQGTFNNGIEVLEYMENHTPDLVFLDIQMPDLNGLQLSRNLPEKTKIIFTTAFDQYALESYKVNALDYLVKPIDYGEFLTAANKAKSWFSHHSKDNMPAVSVSDSNVNKYIFVKSEYKTLKINLADILYIEGLKDYVKIYIERQESPILTLLSMKKLEAELPDNEFMRVHRSFIVSLSKIEEVERNQIVIRGNRITVAEQYKSAFKLFLENRTL
ncbi:LytR/AlgR family response regulator transcription factor [Sphingobacterium sp. LRF_L2]|uniref:LytR/AlgR family response regulator transcription factor n=1 Tax=Sphingobacterium sp. LRF_L2 TaxID=3369421 RepID=UPI003F6244E3